MPAILNPTGPNPTFMAVSVSPPTAVPATIAASGTYNSGYVSAAGYNKLALSAQLTQAGTLTIQRYLDSAGNVPIGSAITQSLTANTLGTVAVNDGLPFAFWQASITNSGGSTGTLSNVILFQAI